MKLGADRRLLHFRPYQIHFEGLELDLGSMPGDEPAINSSAKNAVASSNIFEIEGGVTLFPKEVAGIVVGILAAVVLLVGGFVLGARVVRKRKSVNESSFPKSRGSVLTGDWKDTIHARDSTCAF